MKKIEQHYGADLDWVDFFSKNFNGEINGNFIKVPNDIQTGDQYVLECGEGIVALYIDLIYHIDFELIIKNYKNDFVGVFYNLSEGEIEMKYQGISRSIGALSYDLFVIDSSLECQYEVHCGSKYFLLCLFIKKELVKKYFERSNAFGNKINDLFDSEVNTMIRFDRMSNDSLQLLSELRKNEVGKGAFDLKLVSTAFLLLSEYFKKLGNNEIVVQLVDEYDLSCIIEAQYFLIENVESIYPGNKVMAQNANMSESKFNSLFKKITGISPNAFFIEKKLEKAKEFLETKKWGVSDVSRRLGFIDGSYFAYHFKKKFGINPKEFIQKL